MGHLVNPSAMRIGWFCYWEDFWFVDFSYYSEFLHLILKIRLFLLYFFSFRFLERCGFLYSHFIVIKNFKLILIKIFFINGLIDELIDDFLQECDEFIYSRRKAIKSLRSVRNFRLFIILVWISDFILKDLILSRNRLLLRRNNVLFRRKNYMLKKNKLFLKIEKKYFFLREKLKKNKLNNNKLLLFKNNIKKKYYLLKKNNLLFRKKMKKENLLLKWKYYYLYLKKNFFLKFNLNKFMYIFRFFSFINIKYIIVEIFKENINMKKKYKFLFLFYIFRQIMRLRNSFEGANKIIVKIVFFMVKYKNLFIEIDKFLSTLLLYLFNICDNYFKFDFFLLRNIDVNAKFLSRYIARKLQQGFFLKRLSKTLSKELNKVSSYINALYFINIKLNLNNKYKIFNLNIFLKSLFLRLLNLLLNIYKLECCKYYKLNSCWLNFDSFILLYWILNKFNYIEEKIGISFFYFQYKGGFNLFFNNDCFLMSNFFLSNYLRMNIFIPFKNIRNLEFSHDFIYVSLYTFNFSFFDYFIGFMKNAPLLKISMCFFYKSLKYNFFIRDYFIVKSLKKNIFKFKKNLKILHGFFGFKFHFKGRFSRRQKALSVVYNFGKVPLTKLNANIDYSFYTIPLLNSAISVKIWIYHNKLLSENNLLKINYK